MIDRPAHIFSRDQHPRPFQLMSHTFQLSFRCGFYQHMATLQPFGSRSIRRSDKMQIHRLVAPDKASEPWTTVKTYRQLTGFFQMSFDTPTPKFAEHPFGSIIIGIRANGTTSKTISQDIQLMHYTIIGRSYFYYFLHGGRLSIYISGIQRGHQKRHGTKVFHHNSFALSMINDCKYKTFHETLSISSSINFHFP